MYGMKRLFRRPGKVRRATVETLESRQLLSSVTLDFNGGAGGVANSGFTGVLPNSVGSGLISSNLGLSSGKLLVTTTAGDLTRNNQDDVLDLAVNGGSDFVVQARLASLPFKANWQNGGIFVGTNQDNYVKIVAGFNGTTSLQLGSESGGAFSSAALSNFSFSGVTSLDFRLVGTASTKTVVAQYRINSDSDAAWVKLGQVTNSAIFSSSAKGGIVSTNLGSTPVQVAYESFTATSADVVPPPPPPPPSTGKLSVGANVNASKMGGNQEETEIGINPTNSNNVVTVGVNSNNGGSALLISRSFDGGKTWTTSSLGASQDHLSGSTPRVDPHLTFDSFGNLYVTYEVAASSTEIRIIVARSKDGGQTFTASAAVSGQGLNIDYPIIGAGPDATNLANQTLWVGYTDTKSKRIRIVGARSTGLGNLGGFSAPVTVSDANGSYGSVAVGPLGQVVVAWQTSVNGQGPAKISMDVDGDGLGSAKAWGSDKFITSTNVGGFDFIPAQPNRSVDANIGLTFDRSSGPARGRLYLVYADENGNESNDLDVMLRYTDNLGASWSSPLRVNDDKGVNSQFLPAMAVDQTSGNIAIIWRDARNSAGNNTAELWGTVSLDHGVSVLPNVKIGAMSNQAGANGVGDDLDFGDYQGVAFSNGKFIPVWADNSNSTGDNPAGAGKTFDLYSAVVTLT
jgi:hypothetical protein